MQLFYAEGLQEQDSEYRFDKEESRHIVKVLRKQEGDILYLTNGQGLLITSVLTHASEKSCQVQLQKFSRQIPKRYSLRLAVAPTKMNDRYEWFLEKATEIGVDEIIPIICDHSERKIIKTDRMEKIILSAMKQSLHTFLPKLSPQIELSEFLQTDAFEGQRFIAHCDKGEKAELKRILQPDTPLTILIGPEGDFSTKEIALALKHNYQPVSLGNTRLRTETAALVACHTAALLND